MTSNAIVQKNEEISELRARIRNVRARFESEAEEVQGIAVEGISAYIFGQMEARAQRESRTLATVGGLKPELAYGIAGIIGGKVIGGSSGALVSSAGRAMIAVHMYKTGREAGVGR